MKVRNVHEREIEAEPSQVGVLIDSLVSKEDRLWPRHAWPRMALDRALGVGATGGHGPIRYFVEEYTAGNSIKFRFTRPKGFDGHHIFEITSGLQQPVVLRHTLKMNTRGLAVLSWLLVYRPLHDALLEDSLAMAQASLGLPPAIQPWSLWVRILRWVVSGGQARSQITPNNSPRGMAQDRRD